MPLHAFKNTSRALRCLLRLFTTSVPIKNKSIIDKGRQKWGGKLAGLDERGLKHVRQKRKDGVQRREFGRSLVGRGATVHDTREKLGKDGQIQNEGCGEKGVLR